MEKVPHLCIDESMHSMDDTFASALFVREKLSLNGCVLRNEHAKKDL